MGWIGCLGVAVSIVVLITLTSLYVYLLIKWLSCKSFWTSRMKFEQWLDLYYLNPEEWRLEDTPNRYIYRSRRVYGGGLGAVIGPMFTSLFSTISAIISGR